MRNTITNTIAVIVLAPHTHIVALDHDLSPLSSCSDIHNTDSFKWEAIVLAGQGK